MKVEPSDESSYWRENARRVMRLDRRTDPLGLTIVCHPHLPIWYNQFVDYTQRAALSRLLEKISSIDGKNALDIGCGTGRWMNLLVKFGASPVFGIDISTHTLVQSADNGPCFCMSAHQLGFRESSFEIVNCVTVLQHVPHSRQEESIREISRVLRPGGHLALIESVPSPFLEKVGFYNRIPHMFVRSRNEWVALLARYGMSVVDELGVEFAPLLEIERFASFFLERAFALLVRPFRFGKNLKWRRSPARLALLRLLVSASYRLEAPVSRALPAAWARHGAFLCVKDQVIRQRRVDG